MTILYFKKITCFLLFALIFASCESYAMEQAGTSYRVLVLYPQSKFIDSLMKETVESVIAPDITPYFTSVPDKSWRDSDALIDFLLAAQKSQHYSGVVLACKNNDLNYITRKFRKSNPKVPIVDTIAPSLLAANVIAYRYIAISGAPQTLTNDVLNVAQDLKVLGHMKVGPVVDNAYLIEYNNFALDHTPTDAELQDTIVAQALGFYGSDRTNRAVINVEAVALVGCNGFISHDIDIKLEAAFKDAKAPLQVVHPIKAAVTQLQTLIRSKVWISSPY